MKNGIAFFPLIVSIAVTGSVLSLVAHSAPMDEAMEPATNPSTMPAMKGDMGGMSMPDGMNMAASSQPAASTNPSVFHARGRIVTAAFEGKAGEGAALIIDHEDIPGFMNAMRMTFRVPNPTDAIGLHRGDKITFDLMQQANGDFAMTNIHPLPAETKLKLAGVKTDVPDVVEQAAGKPASTQPASTQP